VARRKLAPTTDLKIAEQLLLDWFAAAIRSVPRRGKLLSFASSATCCTNDSHESVNAGASQRLGRPIVACKR